ncbi:MAG: hypothetical protein FJZ01_09495 [Candidatus Sericytochromatia bacterium]|nr:hypothetical protein [Candidatus Tanganyikabacteria bacterium]
MADLNVSGARPATNPLPQAEASFAPSEVLKEISSAQKRMETDRIEAQNPGAWTRIKEAVPFVGGSSKKEREARIRTAEKMDKIMDQLYEMVFKVYQGLINPQAASG